MSPPPVVDADAHVLEPRDTWERYLEPGLRERAIRIADDADGVEVLLVDGRPHRTLRGRLAGLGGIGMDSEDLLTLGRRRYEDGCPEGGYDPAARLQVLDDEGIDVALLYPTIGICWEGLTDDPALSTAYCRAYNRWLVDFCSHDRKPPGSRRPRLPEGPGRRGPGGRARPPRRLCGRSISLAGPRVAQRSAARRPRARPLLVHGCKTSTCPWPSMWWRAMVWMPSRTGSGAPTATRRERWSSPSPSSPWT